MDLQQTIVLSIGIALGLLVVHRIVKAFRRKDPNLCSGCTEKDCPHRNRRKRNDNCCS